MIRRFSYFSSDSNCCLSRAGEFCFWREYPQQCRRGVWGLVLPPSVRGRPATGGACARACMLQMATISTPGLVMLYVLVHFCFSSGMVLAAIARRTSCCGSSVSRYPIYFILRSCLRVYRDSELPWLRLMVLHSAGGLGGSQESSGVVQATPALLASVLHDVHVIQFEFVEFSSPMFRL